MKRAVKKVAESILGPLGYRIADERNIHDEVAFVRRVRAAGFSPKTIIDIGVAHGTPYLYFGFPETRFHLFDPTRESLPHMQRWQKEIDASIYNFALGAESSQLEIRVRDTIQHATFLPDIGAPPLRSTYKVDVRRFDELDLEIEAPCLVKIDVEGFELEVLKGMARRMDQLDLIVVETSLASLYEGGVDALEVVNFMQGSGFRVVDIAGITRRPADSLIHQIDYVFARNGTPFAARRWR